MLDYRLFTWVHKTCGLMNDWMWWLFTVFTGTVMTTWYSSISNIYRNHHWHWILLHTILFAVLKVGVTSMEDSTPAYGTGGRFCEELCFSSSTPGIYQTGTITCIHSVFWSIPSCHEGLILHIAQSLSGMKLRVCYSYFVTSETSLVLHFVYRGAKLCLFK